MRNVNFQAALALSVVIGTGACSSSPERDQNGRIATTRASLSPLDTIGGPMGSFSPSAYPAFYVPTPYFADFRDLSRSDNQWTGGTVKTIGGIPALEMSDTSTTGYTSAISPAWTVAPSTRYVLSGWARTPDGPNHGGKLGLFVYEYASPTSTTVLASHTLYFDSTDAWDFKYQDFTTSGSTGAIKVRFYPCANGAGYTGTGQLAEAKITEPPTSLLNASGVSFTISGAVDLAEQMSAENFWPLVAAPSAPYTHQAINLWSDPELRDMFIGRIPILSVGTADQDLALPMTQGMLGVPVDNTPPQVVAMDIPHRPIIGLHPNHSDKYYPRHMGYYAETFREAYAINGDQKYADRQADMLEYLLYSQYASDGSNAFTNAYYPGAPEPSPQWYGTFDYLFDWTWTDGYHYTWRLHEGDHHVCSLMTTELVRGYEHTGDTRYLNAARVFVHNQVPRYGFHTGLWEGHRYYWTEYNPSGPVNPNLDATDNVQALVAEAVAMVGYHDNDQHLLAYAQGLLWYLAREMHNDGWFFYDGAENPINARKSLSHDSATVYPAFRALSYLRRAGVPATDVLNTYFREILETYTYGSPNVDTSNTGPVWGDLRARKDYQGWKLFSAKPDVQLRVTVTDIIQMTREDDIDLTAFTYRDPIFSDAHQSGGTVDLSVVELTPTQDPAHPFEAGVAVPVTVDSGGIYPSQVLASFVTDRPTRGRIFRIRFDWTPSSPERLQDYAYKAFVMKASTDTAFKNSAVYNQLNGAQALAVTGGDASQDGNFFQLPMDLVFHPVP